jgi:uncharacterized repeat protein (TIGR03803 family)
MRSSLFLLITLLFLPMPAQAGYQILANFNGSNGSNPTTTGLVMDSAGNLYGVTQNGGTYSDGTLFRLNTNGAIDTLVNFNGADGANPGLNGGGNLLRDNNGNIYGTTDRGSGPSNYGTVFEYSSTSGLTTLYQFNPNASSNPAAYPTDLIRDSNGNLYGTTAGGFSNLGTVFKLSSGGALTTLATFNGYNGQDPGSLILDGSGNLYGVTYQGGTGYGPVSAGNGTVFEITASGAFKTLFDFDSSNGLHPNSLIEDNSGNLYGTTAYGIFKLTPSGTLSALAGLNNAGSGGLIMDASGNFYGTALYGLHGIIGSISPDNGDVFKFSSSGALSSLHSFTGPPSDGSDPEGNLIADSHGNLYGTTANGGSSNEGTIFELTGIIQPAGPTAAPEPCTLLLLGQGATALLGLARRGRRRFAEKSSR